ncbi:MAG: acyl-CoA thioesterase [Myxococcales bacterium]
MPAALPDASLFRFEIDVPVRWGDMDALGHVNNTVYFTYFEMVRIAYFDRIGAFSRYASDGLGPILASTHCDFLLPVKYPATLKAAVRVARVGQTSFAMEYLLRDAASGAAVAKGTAVNVFYDYRAEKKIPVPDFIRRAIGEVEGG